MTDNNHQPEGEGRFEEAGRVANLFEEMRIGTMTARNRIVRSATAESLATPAGGLTPELLGL